jgi:HAD superfamily hydrolase (TIGR01509 family)
MTVAHISSSSPFAAVDVVVFDVDGTLIDSIDAHATSWQQALAQFGHRVPYSEVRAQIGKGADELLPAFLSAVELHASADRIGRAHDDIYRRDHKDYLRPFPGVRQLVATLREDGKTGVMASTGTRADVEFCERQTSISGMVDGIAIADDAARWKPGPDIFRIALDRAGCAEPGRAMMVGDSPWDAKGALRAGMRSIGLRSGGFAESDLLRAGNESVYDDITHLLALQSAGRPMTRSIA